jgi:predicted nucleic acid-binding protein
MKKVVVDTDIIIDYLRQPRKDTLLRKLITSKTWQILLPAVCLTELYVGRSVARPKEEARLKRSIRRLKLVLAGKEVSKRAGFLMREYPNLFLADALVAATALVEKAPLCTFNRTHFEKIPGLKLWES